MTKRKKIKVTIPAGIDNGQMLRDRGNGEPGTNGGPRGDLLVSSGIPAPGLQAPIQQSTQPCRSPCESSTRRSKKIRIKTVDGEVEYDVETGNSDRYESPSEKGKGVPSLRNRNVRGDHFVTLVVQVPSA